MNNISAIILAGGKGKRMNSKKINKVAAILGNKQMILHTIDLLDKLNIVQKIVVVGFAKKSVIDILKGRVIFAEQKKQLGTADAVACALKYLSKDTKDVLILNGDDSAFYKEKTIKNLFKKHNEKKSSLTFLTIELDNPTGNGRVVRNNSGNVVAIVEEKDASLEQKRINEVNPACYIFEVSFLKNYLSKIKKSNITHEYYLTNLVDLAFKNNEKIETVMEKNLVWRGINTEDELREANRLFLQAK
jgi:bifunctional N-acetylglucosamine-1-phosphate-uridyltransferase/glucosamine-1-phosphate-acetyltransferase GlmU-like protein